MRLPFAAAFAAVFVFARAAQADVPAPTKRCEDAGNCVETVVVTGRRANLAGLAVSANQGSVDAADIALRPLLRPGEIVENVPGVIVTQHSGSGKANQYFLRGFNLDHGTDLAVSVDGVPVNMPSHAHGQGYADLNFLIPELVKTVDFRKGPYYADVGDFGSAGAFDIQTYDQLPSGFVHVEGGQFGYGRGVGANDADAGEGNILYAVELEHDDGPWDIPDNERKLDGLLRYTEGDDGQGFSLTAMAYHNKWHSTDQVPDRAITEGLIDRWGAIDPTDGGMTGRYGTSAEWHAEDGDAATKILLYGLYYNLDLFSDFTYFLFDPIHGDQIEQEDNRFVFGGQASRTWFGNLLGSASDTTIGFDLRNDDIRNGLFHTEARLRLNPVQIDRITETSAAPFVQNETRWTNWLRTTLGVREDFFAFDVRNFFGGNSGSVNANLFSPKAALVMGPWNGTEFYLDGGFGYHSNDARGIVSISTHATPLPRSEGAEAGLRTDILPGLESGVSVWLLDLQSELVWDADVGTNVPSGPSRRYGVEFANYYTPSPWLTVDADYAWSRARFTDNETEGDYVPEALVATFDGGVAIHDLDDRLRNCSAALRLRYFGPRPLTQDGAVWSRATTLVYADLGYKISPRWSVALDIFNLLDTQASDIDYYYTSRLPGEPAAGVAGVHTHPAEPREFRIGLTAAL